MTDSSTNFPTNPVSRLQRLRTLQVSPRLRLLMMIVAVLVVTLVSSPRAHATNGNILHDGKDVAWTNGPKVIAVEDRECDYNDAAVRHKFSRHGKVHILRDGNGCKSPGTSRRYPNTGNYKNKRLYSEQICEYIGKTLSVDHCTHWKKLRF